MSRREFTAKVKVEIIKRATTLCSVPDGKFQNVVLCEKCRLPAKRWDIDHRDPDALQIDKSKPLTAADGWLLCLPCHKEKSRKDVADIAKAKRREAAHLNIRRPKQSIPSAPGSLRGPARKHEGRPSLPPKEMFK